MGLGLSFKRVLGLTMREREALQRAWERKGELDAAMYYQLRADIHNSSENLNREDKRRWKAQDFGADEAPESQQGPKAITREQVRAKALMTFGPGENGSVLKALKGQSLPTTIQVKIDAAKSRPKPQKRRSAAYAKLKGQ
jgi:hypothetical protein